MNDSCSELIRCISVEKVYSAGNGSVPALVDVTLSVPAGESLALVGPSGCGKSTLLLLMAGLERPTRGRVEFHGVALSKPHRDIALVLQDYGLFPWKTVEENVALGLRIRHESTNGGAVADLLAELDVAEKRHVYPGQLSGGQKQRVALARALVLKPALLLLDEPFAALDTLTRERLQDLVAGLWRSRGFGMILVTHNIQEAVRLGRRIAVMGPGPGRIISLVENPSACSPDYRGSDDFNDKCAQVRSALEATA